MGIVLGIKRGVYRIHDPDKEVADAAYAAVRRSVIARSGCRCTACTFTSVPDEKAPATSYEASGFLEAHHLDDDHSNNEPGNLAVQCPFCHEVHHAGNAGHLDRVLPIWLPALSHEDFHLMMHLLFAVRRMGALKGQGLPPGYTVTGEWLAEADRVYAGFRRLNEQLPEQLRDARVLGTALGRLPNEKYRQRDRFLGGIKLLPIESAFERHIDYWTKNAWPKIGNPAEQWPKLASQIEQIAALQGPLAA
jgi:hypothetical protein